MCGKIEIFIALNEIIKNSIQSCIFKDYSSYFLTASQLNRN